MKVSYFIPQCHSSKALYRKQASTGANLIDEMDRLAQETFGSAPFLYVSNNGRKSLLDGEPTVRRIPVVSHGLNKYEKYSNIYFSAALNREPQHFWVLKALGLDAKHVHTATAHEMLYQCVLRTSLRDPASTEPVHATVADEPSARRLAALVGTNDVSQLGSLYSPPRKPLTATQKAQRHEAKKAREALYAPKSQPSWYVKEDGRESGALPNVEGLQDNTTGGNSPTCIVTFHEKANAFTRNEFKVRAYTIHELLAFLRCQSRAVIDKKEEPEFFNPCVFDPPEGAEGYRRKDYFKLSSFLVLDFDDGDLSPEELNASSGIRQVAVRSGAS